jgi:hypothetical protein
MNKKQREKRKTLSLTPMLPKKFNSRERAEIRRKEKEILGGK